MTDDSASPNQPVTSNSAQPNDSMPPDSPPTPHQPPSPDPQTPTNGPTPPDDQTVRQQPPQATNQTRSTDSAVPSDSARVESRPASQTPARQVPAEPPEPPRTPRPLQPPEPPEPPQLATPAVEGTQFGRVDADGTVYVITESGERAVGQWPGGDPDAALAFYRNRFAGLVAEVNLLEKRLTSGALSPSQAAKAVERLRAAVTHAQAVGDLEALSARLDGLTPALEQAKEAQRGERTAKAAQARQARQVLVEQAEALASGNNWSSGQEKLRELIEKWKALSRTDKSRDDALWQRLAAARTTYTKRRRQHFAALDEKRKTAAEAKEHLIAAAQELSSSTDWAATTRAYRDLMTRWKAAGAARRDVEDALWKRFRAAQDTFFTAREAQNAEVDAQYSANAEVKRALLAEAEELLPVRDPRAAREAFRPLASRWDAAGKVSRQDLKELEARFTRVDTEIRRAEDDRWRRSNPEAAARAAATIAQLDSAIAAVRDRLSAAEGRGDERAAEQARADLAARQSWLSEASKALEEFSG